MSPKRDIQQINSIDRMFKMDRTQHKRFGKFLEGEKLKGNGGTLNEKGDFTYSELKQKAKEFLGDY